MAYCSQTDIEHLLSTEGVDLRTDDASDGDAEVTEVIEEADTEIDQACSYLYTAASLAASTWVKHKAKTIAAYLLCERRGNPAPASLASKYEKALAILEKVRTGSLIIPNCVMSKGLAPTMSNMRPALRPHPRSVVEPSRSTGKAEGYSQTNRDPMDWTNQNSLNYVI